jgi:hypothetical protein
MGPMVNMALIPLIIPQSKAVEPKLLYGRPESYITRTMTHHGKTDAMFDYFKQSNNLLHK